jgi:hypothetical protein
MSESGRQSIAALESQVVSLQEERARLSFEHHKKLAEAEEERARLIFEIGVARRERIEERDALAKAWEEVASLGLKCEEHERGGALLSSAFDQAEAGGVLLEAAVAGLSSRALTLEREASDPPPSSFPWPISLTVLGPITRKPKRLS